MGKMRVFVNTEKLQKALKRVSYISTRSPLAILQGVKIEAVRGGLLVSRTDFNTHAQYVIDDCNVAEEGAVLISDISKLEKTVKMFSEDETLIEFDGTHTMITSGSKSMRVSTEENVEAIEAFETGTTDDIYTTNTKQFYSRLKRVSYARAKKANRESLRGIHMKGIDMVALDGYRIAVDTDKTLEVAKEFTMQSETVDYLLGTMNRTQEMDVSITRSGNYVSFVYDSTTVVGKLIEGEYLDYELIYPQDYDAVELSTYDTREDITFLNVLARETEHSMISMTIRDTTLTLEVADGDGIFKTGRRADTGLSMQVSFNSERVLESLKLVRGETLELRLAGTEKPFVFVDGSTTHLILPVIKA